MRRHVPPLLAMLLLAGCAAQRAYDDGRALVAQGHMDAGLQKLQQALAADPRDARYREAFLQTRERALAADVEQADRLAAGGQAEAARTLYRHALGLDPRYPRALDGLAALERAPRQAALLDEADRLAKDGQPAAARERVDRVLAESPANARAQAIRRVLDERASAAAPEAQLARNYRHPVTIEFKDATLRQVFDVIARGTSINFLFDKDVKTDQRTSVFLKNSTVEQAVRAVLLTNQLEQQVVDGNTVLIYPNTAAKQKDYQQLDVRTFYLANSEAKTVAQTLKGILKMRDVVVDDKLNLLIVRDTPDAIRMAARLIELQDIPEPEVMLEVEVIEVQKTRLQNLGIEWPGSVGLTPLPLGTVIGSGGVEVGSSTDASTGTTTAGLSLYDLLHQTRRSLGATVGSFTVDANVADTDVRLLTNPRIRARNHEKAKILIGERVPNITSTATSTGFVSQSVSYLDIGLTLNVEPTVYLDDDVGIKIGLEVSSLLGTVTTSSGTSAPTIGTRTATTALRLKNGETEVLAGLIDSQERTSGNKVPGIGDLPVAGRLFGASKDDDENTEIVLSITPHLIRNIRRPDAVEAGFHSGTEASLHGGREGAPAAPYVAPAVAAPPAAAGSGSQLPSASTLPSAGSESTTDTASESTAATAASAGTDAGAAAAAAGTGTLQWAGPAQVATGGTLAIQVLASSSLALTSLPLTLAYDATKLQFADVSEGPFMKQGGGATSFSSRLLSDGHLSLSDTATVAAGPGAPAVFATVTFKALAPVTATQVSLLAATAAGASGAAVAMAAPEAFTVKVVAP